MKQVKRIGAYAIACLLATLFFNQCESTENIQYAASDLLTIPDVLDYHGTPDSCYDRSSFVFSDQGAWFGFGIHDQRLESTVGFSGPFLMTQENGVWASKELIGVKTGNEQFDHSLKLESSAYLSHLEQQASNDFVSIQQKLHFVSGNTAILSERIENISGENQMIAPEVFGELFLEGMKVDVRGEQIAFASEKSGAIGYLKVLNQKDFQIKALGDSYTIQLSQQELKTGESFTLLVAISFMFEEYSEEKEIQLIRQAGRDIEKSLGDRINEKKEQFDRLKLKVATNYQDEAHEMLVQKCVLTLQNNWRQPAGELKHAGMFPSYHYIWFNGFWAWDSWKHAVAVAQYDPELAKEQIRAMYHFQKQDGFIPDCVYRDTTIEPHNYRNTKAPLSGWAVWKVFEQDGDLAFLEEMYTQVKRQHEWWYHFRDHDQDGLCEYGSTDGSLIAGKWESGMDNAVRFDETKVLKNETGGYSLDQESVDLNAYLYAEKMFLHKMALELGKTQEADHFKKNGELLEKRIQSTFYDHETGWFYDTSIDGERFVLVRGCEGWIPLWAGCASEEQAERVKNGMMSADRFNTYVPLQTLSADHPKFKPDRGYWRGPNWLDQSYFGVMGLRNYSYDREANELTDKLFQNAEGVMEKGKTIRENYQPITGEGMESFNFSWSAAHYLLLLLNQ